MKSESSEINVEFEWVDVNLNGQLLVQDDLLVDKLKAKISEVLDVPSHFLELFSCDLDLKETSMDSSWLVSGYSINNTCKVIIKVKDLEEIKAFKNLKQSIFDDSFEIFSKIDQKYPLAELLKIPALMNNWTCLHFAASVGSAEILEVLLKHASEIINLETTDCWTPLMLAVAHGHLQICSKMLKVPGIQIDYSNKRGSALHIAVGREHKDIVQLLLLSKASLSVEDERGRRPIEITENQEILELIAKFQGNLEISKYAQEARPTFVGEVFLYNSGIFIDSSCFLNINLEKGTLEEFPDKLSLLSKKETGIFVYLSEIQEVKIRFRNSWNLRGNFYFQVIVDGFQPIYYTRVEEVRDEWVEKISQSIEYCKKNGIGQEKRKTENDSLFTVTDPPFEDNSPFALPENLDIDSFDRMSELGSGSFASVYKVKSVTNGKLFAMKCLSKRFLEKKRMLSYAQTEIEIMKDLTHPFILKLVHSIETPMCIYLILEFCEKGDLETFMENNQISELKAKFMLAEIVLALEYLHSKNVIYRDLKPANILLDSYGHVRLADFGLAKEINEQELSVSTIVGSPAYISPEILARENITKATDKYALGIVMHQLLTNELPFAHLDMDRIFSLIRKGQLKFSGELGRDARDLVVSLTNRKAQKRPSYEEIKKHVFFKGIDWQVMMQKRYLPPDH